MVVAEFLAVPQSHAYGISGGLEDARAIFAGPLASVVHLFHPAAPDRSFRLGIIGAAIMGSLALKMALYMGAREMLMEV